MTSVKLHSKAIVCCFILTEILLTLCWRSKTYFVCAEAEYDLHQRFYNFCQLLTTKPEYVEYFNTSSEHLVFMTLSP